MILDGSENSDAKTAQTVRSEGSEADPQSPPPYTPSSGFTELSDQKPLPTPPHSPPASSAGDYEPGPPHGLPPPCNHLVQRRSNDSVKGTWYVDPAMPIPDALLPSIENFDGLWNEADQKARKERKKLEKKGKHRDESLPAPNAIRPNLFLGSNNSSVDAKVHVISSGDQSKTALIVAEGRNGSVTLDIKTYAPQPLRIFAISENASVRVRIPNTFEGAVIASSKYGSIKISDPIKSRMTTFSTVSDITRAFIGDWQAAGFGTTASNSSTNPNDDPPLPTTTSDPFTTWSGPIIHIASRNGSVNLSYSEETRVGEEETGFANSFKGFMSGLFGTGGGARGGPGDNGRGGNPRGGGNFPWGNGPPWGNTRHPWGNGAPWGQGPPWGPPMTPPGPFGRGGGPFARGGGPFGRGCGSYRPGGFGSNSPGCSRRSERGGDEPHNYEEQSWGGKDIERDPYGFPKDKKDPPTS
ncbi:hypothetical protein RSOLAG1IB_08747 [Rhizoctonia solani AG-1 IB]|uniref:DUF7330 domain-containing protein n=1 Tax=Thanatephorus cucumeris (strain AG1-IB / isolate 7/3/14) TaxID=1108050 RepID=A0A0B7FR43_THACB|nr:hypothetical protein RSOLAG1IB_08747 [Rhizoctonia solani AG-1 IB]